MATLKDVAKLACVDVSTVSRALNNTSYVHPDTKARIYAAVKELSYQPNVLAQGLRQGKRHTIGVVANYEACGYDAVKYLAEKGCRQIGFINGPLELAPYKGRYQGYQRAIKELELSTTESRSSSSVNSFDYGYLCAEDLLDQNPDLDGIIVAVDIQGMGALRSLKERGIKVPDQIRLISLTGHSIGAFLETTMTSLEIAAIEMGEKAARMIIDEIEAPTDQKPSQQHLVFASTLVEREST